MALTVNQEKCTGCGNCKDFCPMDAITINENRAVIGDACVECGACVHQCPHDALHLE